MLTTQRYLHKHEDLEDSAKALGIYDTAVDGYVRAVYTSQQDDIWKYCIGKCVLGRTGGGDSREVYSAITFISSALAEITFRKLVEALAGDTGLTVAPDRPPLRLPASFANWREEIVPSHAIASGMGIRAGAIYTRTPKPESVPVTTPEHWDKVIQRCVLARRDEMIAMFSAIVSGGGGTAKDEPDDTRERLTQWHEATQRAAIQEAGRLGLKLNYPLAENFVQFSYLVRHRKGEAIPADKALAIVEKVNTAVRDTVRCGWSMFYPFTRPEISPQFMTDHAVDGGDTEFLQTSLYDDGQTGHGDFWRITLDGRASILRNLHEDRYRTPANVPVGQKWFDPWVQVRDITEIVRHARAYAEEFSNVTDICFQLEWKGLKSRVIASLNPERYWSQTYTARSDRRNIYECVPQAEVIGDLPAVVATLFAPVHRLFNPSADISATYVARAMKGFIVQGL